MYNWADNIPNSDEKRHFLMALDQIKHKSKPRILEIGTFTGSSIMAMKQHVPHAECTAIDNWKLNNTELDACSAIAGIPITMMMVRDAFNQNTKNQVRLIENDSTCALINLIENKEKFDLIYIDGSHRASDTLLDLSYAWLLLDQGGILAIDDYQWIPQINPDDRPKVAIDLFLAKLKTRYIILYSGYRIFLRKY